MDTGASWACTRTRKQWIQNFLKKIESPVLIINGNSFYFLYKNY